SVWRLHAPPDARVMIRPSASEDRPIGEIEKPAGTDRTLRVVRLKAPTLDPLQLVIQMEQKRGHGAIPIGPFIVEGAAQQRGEVLIAAPADVRLRVSPHS